MAHANSPLTDRSFIDRRFAVGHVPGHICHRLERVQTFGAEGTNPIALMLVGKTLAVGIPGDRVGLPLDQKRITRDDVCSLGSFESLSMVPQVKLKIIGLQFCMDIHLQIKVRAAAGIRQRLLAHCKRDAVAFDVQNG